jgi:predicted lysophospholipase L1 biosynthesis ABC-type transport system permease subunit
MFLTLGLAATLVAVIGMYGVRSYLVAQRTREFGVRMAVGASRIDVLRMVFREAMWNTVVGLAIGLALGIVLEWGLSGDLSHQTVRSHHDGRRDGDPCRIVDHCFARASVARCQRDADNSAA